MTAFALTHNISTDPRNHKPNDMYNIIAKIGYNLNAFVTEYNALKVSSEAPPVFIPVPLSAFREVDANGDLAGLIGIKASGVLNLTADITISSVEYSSRLNGLDITLQVLAAAANPTDTVLISAVRVDNDLTITVTPNDGTNNSATPVGLTTAQLVLAINGSVSATYDSIVCTITDSEGYLALLTASGGDATALADSGEGDGISCSLFGGQASNGGILSYYSTPVFASKSYGSDGDNSGEISWIASNNDPLRVDISLDPLTDPTEDLEIHFRIKSAGTTDAVGFDVESWFNEGDTKVADTSGTNQTATYAEVIATIAAADIPTGAQSISFTLAPVAHTTDAMYLSSCWIEGTGTRTLV